ncbi:MAG TPA: substrate-binding domain-containing protein, partial [Chloroflexota bacterium]|nr:substrate-binding domain-containing protein [Chloroflexota bacterium]
MGRRVASAALDSQVRARRILAGLSQQELARQAGLTRQAISAIEGGRYVPNTVVALRLARILSCRVEELFALPEAMAEHAVELAPPAAGPPAHHRATATRIVVAHLRDRWIAHPLTARRGLLESFTSADGVLDLPATPEAPATARLLIDPEHIARTAVLLGCDPGLGIVSSHMARLARSSADGRLVWLEAGSQAALDAAASGTAHLAGSHLLDRASGECNLPQAKQALAATGGVVVAFASWEQGLVVAPGNPKAICTPAD